MSGETYTKGMQARNRAEISILISGGGGLAVLHWNTNQSMFGIGPRIKHVVDLKDKVEVPQSHSEVWPKYLSSRKIM